MFNIYTFNKKLSEKQILDKRKSQFISNIIHKKTINDKLSQNYKKRIENFVINMVEAPIIVNNYQGYQTSRIRDEHPEKFLGDPQIYVTGFKHEKDRIQMTLKYNENLDFSPNKRVDNHNFRDRIIEKEIQPEMRFTSKTSLERIQSFIKENTMTQVENEFYRDAKKAINRNIVENIPENLTQQQKRIYLSQQIAKNILPSLHQKTHFQAAQILYNNMPIPSLLETERLKKQSKTQSSTDLLALRIQDNIQNKQREQLFRLDTKESEILNNTTDYNDQDNLKSNFPKINSQRRQTKNVQISDSLKQLELSPTQRSFQIQKGERKAVDPLTKAQKQAEMMEAFNPIQTSQQMLLKCQVLHERSKKVKQIHKGEGHQMFASDRTIGQIYKEYINTSPFSKSFQRNQGISSTVYQ